MLEYFGFILLYFIIRVLVNYNTPPTKSLSPKDHKLLIAYYLGFLHTSLTLLLSSISHYSTAGASYITRDTPLQQTIIKHTIGYLTYDLIIESIEKILDIKMALHHIFGIIGGLAMLYEGTAGSAAIGKIYLVALLLTEMASPMFQIKNILELKGLKDWWVAQLNEAIFALVFVTFRVVPVWILLFNMICAGFNWVAIANSALIYVLGVIWSYTVVCIVRVKVMGVKPGPFERLRDSPFAAGIILFMLTAILPYAVGVMSNWKFINLKVENFTFI